MLKKIFGKIFNNKHSIFVNTIFFGLLLMLLYVLVLLPVIIFFFVQNPNMFVEADKEVYLNKSELYQFASSLQLYSEFFTAGGLCELIRRAISTKKNILHDTLFASYICIGSGLLMQIIAILAMMSGY